MRFGRTYVTERRNGKWKMPLARESARCSGTTKGTEVGYNFPVPLPLSFPLPSSPFPPPRSATDSPVPAGEHYTEWTLADKEENKISHPARFCISDLLTVPRVILVQARLSSLLLEMWNCGSSNLIANITNLLTEGFREAKSLSRFFSYSIAFFFVPRRNAGMAWGVYVLRQEWQFRYLATA